MKNPLALSHAFLAEILTDKSITVDATMGNGNDTLFLAKKSQKVYAFDVQELALKKTYHRLREANLFNVELILAGHETVDTYVSKVDAAIFNLGYLPKADKSIITTPRTTLEAVRKLLHVLVVGGRIAIMVYYGHEGGQDEKESLIDFVSRLPQDAFTVMLYQALNQKNHPPLLVMIEKRKEYTGEYHE